MAAGNYGGDMRASDHDRSRVQSMLNDAYAEGRLTQEEWEERATTLAGAATYSDLDRLTGDLPARYPGTQVSPAPHAWPPQVQTQHTNGMAIAALVCGIGQLAVGLPAGIAAIILGHQARKRIRITGEQGDGLARAGLILGYIGTVGLALLIVLVILLVSVASSSHGSS
jgi:hypothetical protein